MPYWSGSLERNVQLWYWFPIALPDKPAVALDTRICERPWNSSKLS